MTAADRRSFLRIVDEEQLPSPYPKCSLFLRGLARAIDLILALMLYLIGRQAGAVMAILFLSFADGLFRGQSIGKRVCGIKVMYLPSRAGARNRDSVLRNSPFALIVLLGMMPHPLGLPGFFAGLLAIGGIEAWRVWRDPLGQRLGDVWAQTQVVDGKVMTDERLLAGTAAAGPHPQRFMSAAGAGRHLLNRVRRTP